MSSTTDSERLARHLEGVNRADFARKHRMPGGASMISQHLSGNRPISLEAAIVYARGLGISLESISPGNADLAREACRLLGDQSGGSRIAKIDISAAIAAVAHALPGLDPYTGAKVVAAIQAAIDGRAPLDAVCADLTAWLASGADSQQARKRQA